MMKEIVRKEETKPGRVTHYIILPVLPRREHVIEPRRRPSVPNAYRPNAIVTDKLEHVAKNFRQTNQSASVDNV